MKTLIYNAASLPSKDRLTISNLLSLFEGRLNAKWIPSDRAPGQPVDLLLRDVDHAEGRHSWETPDSGPRLAVTENEKWPNARFVLRPIRAFGSNGVVVQLNSFALALSGAAPEDKPAQRREPIGIRISGRIEAPARPPAVTTPTPPAMAPKPVTHHPPKPADHPVRERVAVRWGPPEPIILPPLTRMPGARVHRFGRGAHIEDAPHQAARANGALIAEKPIDPVATPSRPWFAPEPPATLPPLTKMPISHHPVEVHRPATPVIGRTRVEAGSPAKAPEAAPRVETPFLRPSPPLWRMPEPAASLPALFDFESLPKTAEPVPEAPQTPDIDQTPHVTQTPVAFDVAVAPQEISAPAEPQAETIAPAESVALEQEPAASGSVELAPAATDVQPKQSYAHAWAEASAPREVLSSASVETSVDEAAVHAFTEPAPVVMHEEAPPAQIAHSEVAHDEHTNGDRAPAVETGSLVSETLVNEAVVNEDAGEEAALPIEVRQELEALSHAIEEESDEEEIEAEDSAADWWGSADLETAAPEAAADETGNSLFSALEAIKESGQPSILEIAGLPAVCIIPARNVYFTTAPAARLESAIGPQADVSWRACESEAEARRLSGTEQSRQGNLELLWWTASLLTSPADPAGMADQSVRLRRWPPVTESRGRSRYLRYATLLSGAEATPRELAEITGDSLDEVLCFVNACAKMNFLEASAQPASPRVAPPVQTAGVSIIRGMLEKLTSKI